MNRLLVIRNRQGRFFVRRELVGVCALWLSASVAAFAQGTVPALKANQPFSIRATHIAGLPNTKSNCKGTLSAQDNVLRFQQSGKTVAQVDIASVRKIVLGEENMQVGGLPIKIGKAATPYGGGRLVSLFAHKKYDTLTLEYVDADGGVHGTIFQLDKGQGEQVRDELVARGASSSSGNNQATKQSTLEVTHDDK